jgi:hypothetical protein
MLRPENLIVGNLYTLRYTNKDNNFSNDFVGTYLGIKISKRNETLMHFMSLTPNYINLYASNYEATIVE